MPSSTLVQGAAQLWWLVVLRGVFAILFFGALAWFWPGLTVLVLVMLSFRLKDLRAA